MSVGDSPGDAEVELRKAASVGAPLDLSGRERRDVRARVLYELVSEVEDASQLPVRLSGARIIDSLDLTATRLHRPLILEGCEIDMGITLDEAKAPEIELLSCDVGSLSALDLDTQGDFLLVGSTVRHARMSGAHIGGSLVLLNATLLGDISLEGHGLRVDRWMDCRGLTAAGDVILDRVDVGDVLDLGDATVSGNLSIWHGHVGGSFLCIRASLAGDYSLRGDGLHVDRSMDFRELRTSSVLSLDDGHIGDVLDLQGAEIRGPLRLERLQVGNRVLDDELVVSEGVFARGARVADKQLLFDAMFPRELTERNRAEDGLPPTRFLSVFSLKLVTLACLGAIALGIVGLSWAGPSDDVLRVVSLVAIPLATAALALVVVADTLRRRAVADLLAFARRMVAVAEEPDANWDSLGDAARWVRAQAPEDQRVLLRIGAYHEAMQMQDFAARGAAALGFPIAPAQHRR